MYIGDCALVTAAQEATNELETRDISHHAINTLSQHNP